MARRDETRYEERIEAYSHYKLCAAYMRMYVVCARAMQAHACDSVRV